MLPYRATRLSTGKIAVVLYSKTHKPVMQGIMDKNDAEIERLQPLFKRYLKASEVVALNTLIRSL